MAFQYIACARSATSFARPPCCNRAARRRSVGYAPCALRVPRPPELVGGEARVWSKVANRYFGGAYRIVEDSCHVLHGMPRTTRVLSNRQFAVCQVGHLCNRTCNVEQRFLIPLRVYAVKDDRGTASFIRHAPLTRARPIGRAEATVHNPLRFTRTHALTHAHQTPLYNSLPTPQYKFRARVRPPTRPFPSPTSPP